MKIPVKRSIVPLWLSTFPPDKRGLKNHHFMKEIPDRVKTLARTITSPRANQHNLAPGT